MSKQKYNIEHKNYAMKVMEWFYSIETDFDPDKHEVGESNYSIVVNTAPFKSKCLGQILLTGPYKVYIKRTQVDKLNTCNMSVTSYTVTFK